ncbi:hypothetical protein BC629DRAFT_1439211 [Irpex lacteus]|nr:hypothetical protein BC629DRAFT_1439211 [Irpex lacteus]
MNGFREFQKCDGIHQFLTSLAASPFGRDSAPKMRSQSLNLIFRFGGGEREVVSQFALDHHLSRRLDVSQTSKSPPYLLVLFVVDLDISMSVCSILCRTSDRTSTDASSLSGQCIVDVSTVNHIWLVVRAAISSRFANEAWIRRTIIVCLILPYLLFISTAVTAVYVGLKEPQHVYRVKFYCIVDNSVLTRIVSIYGLVFVGGAIILEAWTVWLLYRNRVIIKHLSREGTGLDPALILRVCVFGLYIFLGFCLEVLSLFRWTSSTCDIFFSTSRDLANLASKLTKSQADHVPNECAVTASPLAASPPSYDLTVVYIISKPFHNALNVFTATPVFHSLIPSAFAREQSFQTICNAVSRTSTTLFLSPYPRVTSSYSLP